MPFLRGVLTGAEVVLEGPTTARRHAVLLDFGGGRLDVKISLNGFAPGGRL